MTKLVLYIENYFPGGLERFVFDLSCSDLFEIYILVNSDNLRVVEFALKNNIKHEVVKLSSLKLQMSTNTFYSKFVKVFNFIIYYFTMIPNYFRIKKLLEKVLNYENIIIVNGGYPAALSTLSASIASKKLGFKKVGLSILSSPSPYYSNSIFKFFQNRIDMFVNKYIDFYIPNSEKIKLDLIKYIKIKDEKIYVIYTGVKLPSNLTKINELNYSNKSVKKCDNDIWISMVALLGSTKRQDIVINSMINLDKNIKLLLVGDGPNKDALKAKVISLGIEDRVIFTGWLSNPNDTYLFSDIVVFLSDQEGLPYGVSEAMSYKIPVIASAVGGIPEQIIDNKGGLLLLSNKSNELVEKINLLVHSKDLRDRFSEYSFERVQDKFSINTMNNKILELYKT